MADFTPRRFASEQYSLLINYAALVVEELRSLWMIDLDSLECHLKGHSGHETQELERHKPTKELLDESLGNYVERSGLLAHRGSRAGAGAWISP